MSGIYGFDQIRKVAFFGLAFGEAMAATEGKLGTLAKASLFLSCLDEGLDLISIDRVKLRAEFDEFDSTDREHLYLECVAKFDLEDNALEERIEASLSAGLKILEGIEGVMAAWKGVAQI